MAKKIEKTMDFKVPLDLELGVGLTVLRDGKEVEETQRLLVPKILKIGSILVHRSSLALFEVLEQTKDFKSLKLKDLKSGNIYDISTKIVKDSCWLLETK